MTLEDTLSFLIPVMAVIGISVACAMLKKRGEFSMNVFLSSCAIGISILVWKGLMPIYMMVATVLIIVGMLFMDRGGTNE